MRDADELLASGLAVIDRGFFMGGMRMIPLFSGGHDSLCATHIASQHKWFSGNVWHIGTGIGAGYTRGFVENACNRFGWHLNVIRSIYTFEQFVRERGFPGPGRHSWVYNRLKERCIRRIMESREARLLVTGCRSQESTRRMGFVEPVKVGERSPKTGKIVERKRIWCAPCHDWSKAEQQHYMDEWGLPVNRLKVALGLSGECFCGAFAQPGELERIREFAPDVAEEIDRLSIIAKECGKPCEWGQRPRGKIEVAETGPLCSSCDQRAAAGGFVVPSPPAAGATP